MPSSGSTTLLRGFKVSIAVLDAFLAANCVPETFGTPPFYRDHPDNDSISKLLHSKILAFGGSANATRFRVVIPSRAPYNASRVAYVTYAWVTVFAHREVDLDKDLPAEVPEGFEELRQEVLSTPRGMVVDGRDKIVEEGKMGVYMAFTFDIRGDFVPIELLERRRVSAQQPRPHPHTLFEAQHALDLADHGLKTHQVCDECDATFDDPHYAFGMRQKHRILVHGSQEGTNPLPES